MIKVKILNPIKGRNEPTFRPFSFFKDYLKGYHIDISDNHDSYDFLFVGMADFINKKVSLEQSIEDGLEFCNKITGDYFLFDGSDSTSLMGAYEVLKDSNAVYLFKNQLLKNKSLYLQSSPFGKTFWEGESDLMLNYNISNENWNRIKLSGYNLGWLLPDYHNHYPISGNKPYDICAIYQDTHDYSEDHLVQNNHFYTKHRAKVYKILDKLKKETNLKILTGKRSKNEYLQLLYQSKYAISPFGMGELCFRDFELMKFGVNMVKPNMSIINTYPNPYISSENYLPINNSWDNLEEILINLFFIKEGEFDNQYVENFRKNFKKQYTIENFCMYWYNIFNNLSNVRNDILV